MVGSTIINLTYPTKQHAIRLRVGFDSNIPPTLSKIAWSARPFTHRASWPLRRRKSFCDLSRSFSIHYEVKFWIESEATYNDIVDAIRTNIWYETQRNNIRIPYPIRILQIDRPKARQEESLQQARTSVRKQPFLQLLDDEQTEKLLAHAKLLRLGEANVSLNKAHAANRCSCF
jgi:hypothetical protein